MGRKIDPNAPVSAMTLYMRAYRAEQKAKKATLAADPNFVPEPKERKQKRKSEPVRKQEFIDFCYEKGLEGNVKYAELWAKMTGNIKDKSEVTHKFDLTADELFRLERESAQRVNNLAPVGNQSLPSVSPILLQDIRPVSGQDQPKDDAVATVAVPDGTDRYVPAES